MGMTGIDGKDYINRQTEDDSSPQKSTGQNKTAKNSLTPALAFA